MTPTLLDACSVAAPAGVRFDGKSVLSLLQGIQTTGWPDRTLFFQWHRGDRPELGRSFAARTQRYKLLRHEPPLGSTKMPPLQLFDMERDPLELHDIASEHPEILTRMYAEYKAWFKDVSATRGFEPVRIALGTPLENPTILTPQDWRGPRSDEQADALGYWEVDIAKTGRFDIKLRFRPRSVPIHGPRRIWYLKRRDQSRAGSDRVLVQKRRSARGPRAAGSVDRRKPKHEAASSMQPSGACRTEHCARWICREYNRPGERRAK